MFDPLSNFKLNKILSAINALPTTLASSFTEVKNAIAGVDEKVVNNGDGIDTITGKLDIVQGDLDTLKAKGIIKSIQHGYGDYDSRVTASTQIRISAVDVNKAVPIVQAREGVERGFDEYFLESSTFLRVKSENTTGSSYLVRFSWQVIEFY